jgi:hypothetical protein
MIFINNKYTPVYYKIIENAKFRNLKTRKEAISVLGYAERHHILPKSLGGDNSKNNLIFLSGREHFICHWLLYKMTIGANKSKMANAWFRMCQTNKFQTRYFSRNYVLARKAFSENNPFRDPAIIAMVVERMINNNPMKRPEIVNKVRAANKGKRCGELNSFYGQTHTESTLVKLTGENHYSKKPGYVFPKDAIQKRKNTIAMNNKPRALKLMICPHCGLSGKGGNMSRYHFSNCVTLKN